MFLVAFVVNHSKSYSFAALLSWVEFWIEFMVFGEKKFSVSLIIYVGFLFVIGGQVCALYRLFLIF
jgi:hypothetical protein